MAQLDILFTGYVGERVAGTVSLVRDGSLVAVVDPGMVPDRSAILDPLAALGVSPADVTDVILSHHHPDHTMHIALFPSVRVHDYWAIYERDIWTSRPAEGAELSDGVRLIETPGHTREDITTLVDTSAGVTALTHLWWHATASSDPRGSDLDALHAGRRRVLDVASVIVPGHGAPFTVGADTPS
jgi:glyoxylase-like metal-dependent hydrolase (beta-lactamase superfamily II)